MGAAPRGASREESLRKQVLVTADRGETRVAILEAEGTPAAEAGEKDGGRGRRGAEPKWRVGELYVERRGSRSIVGNVYKGKVDNVLPGLEAAFVDIGLEKNGFLHADDIVIPGVEVARRGRAGRQGQAHHRAAQARPGDPGAGGQGPAQDQGPAAVHAAVDRRPLPGVRAPGRGHRGVAPPRGQGARAAAQARPRGWTLGEGGAIIRTAAQGAKKADFEREIQYLHKLHDVLQKRAEETAAPAMVFQEADLSVRVVRDIFSKQFERAIVDDPQQHHRLESFFTRTAPELLERLELYKDSRSPLFERYGIEAAIQSTLRRRVDLPSGGYLLIEYTEAMTVIDINSGSFTGRGKGARLEDTITKTNLEAAEEVVAPAAAARHRRHHRHRLHRHVAGAKPGRGAQDAPQGARRGPHQDLRRRDLAARPGGDDAPERDRRRARDPHQDLSHLRGRGRGALRGDSGHRRRAPAAGARRRAARHRGVPDPDPSRAWRRCWRAGPGRPLLEIERRDGQALPLRGVRGAADRPLRGLHGGRSRGRRGARPALPRGRGGARDDRGAAHVRRGRRRGQAGRLRDLGGGRRAGSWAARRWSGSRTWAAPRPRPSWWREPRWCPRRPPTAAAPRRAPAAALPRATAMAPRRGDRAAGAAEAGEDAGAEAGPAE